MACADCGPQNQTRGPARIPNRSVPLPQSKGTLRCRSSEFAPKPVSDVKKHTTSCTAYGSTHPPSGSSFAPVVSRTSNPTTPTINTAELGKARNDIRSLNDLGIRSNTNVAVWLTSFTACNCPIVPCQVILVPDFFGTLVRARTWNRQAANDGGTSQRSAGLTLELNLKSNCRQPGLTKQTFY